MSDPKNKPVSQTGKQDYTQAAMQTAMSAGSNAATADDIAALRAQLDAAQSQAADAEARAAKAEQDKQRAEDDLKSRNDDIENDVTRQEEAIKRQLRAQRKVRIIINSGKSQHEQCPVTVAVNGREFLIERDKEVDVPQGVLNVLDLAKELVPNVVEENGQTRAVFRPTQRFSYTVLGQVDAETGILVR